MQTLSSAETTPSSLFGASNGNFPCTPPRLTNSHMKLHPKLKLLPRPRAQRSAANLKRLPLMLPVKKESEAPSTPVFSLTHLDFQDLLHNAPRVPDTLSPEDADRRPLLAKKPMPTQTAARVSMRLPQRIAPRLPLTTEMRPLAPGSKIALPEISDLPRHPLSSRPGPRLKPRPLVAAPVS